MPLFMSAMDKGAHSTYLPIEEGCDRGVTFEDANHLSTVEVGRILRAATSFCKHGVDKASDIACAHLK